MSLHLTKKPVSISETMPYIMQDTMAVSWMGVACTNTTYSWWPTRFTRQPINRNTGNAAALVLSPNKPYTGNSMPCPRHPLMFQDFRVQGVALLLYKASNAPPLTNLASRPHTLAPVWFFRGQATLVWVGRCTHPRSGVTMCQSRDVMSHRCRPSGPPAVSSVQASISASRWHTRARSTPSRLLNCVKTARLHLQEHLLHAGRLFH